MARIFITNSYEEGEKLNPSASVEAEYGDHTVAGTRTTLAHHGANSKNPCPCLGGNIPFPGGVFLVSHFDLDTLGGVMRLMGQKDHEEGREDMFWAVAAQVDTQGVHKLGEIKRSLWREAVKDVSMSTSEFNTVDYFFSCEWENVMDNLHAFWAWSESNRLFAPRDGSIKDVTKFFEEAIRILLIILEGEDAHPEWVQLKKAGQEWVAAKEELNKDSFHKTKKGVILRKSPQFVNHLYNTPEAKIKKAVVAFNTKFKSITVSLADPIPNFSVGKFVQTLWGSEAGGHAVIGGSPRGKEMSFSDAVRAFEELVIIL